MTDSVTEDHRFSQLKNLPLRGQPTWALRAILEHNRWRLMDVRLPRERVLLLKFQNREIVGVLKGRG